MADVYWLSFRIKDDAGYADTYQALIDALKGAINTGSWWFETTSFYVFKSEHSIGDLANIIKKSIRVDRDLVVLGKSEFKAGRVIGLCEDQDIFTLVPFMKKV